MKTSTTETRCQTTPATNPQRTSRIQCVPFMIVFFKSDLPCPPLTYFGSLTFGAVYTFSSDAR